MRSSCRWILATAIALLSVVSGLGAGMHSPSPRGSLNPATLARIAGDGSLRPIQTVNPSTDRLSASADPRVLRVVATVPVGSEPDAAAYDSATGQVFVASQYDENVSVIDDTNDTVVATTAIGDPVMGLAYDPAQGEVFVANGLESSVFAIDDTNDTVVASIPVGAFQYGMVYDTATNQVFTANTGASNVSVINGTTDRVVASVPVSGDPQGLAYDPAKGEVFVTRFGSNNVSVICDGAPACGGHARADAVVATVPVGTYPIAAAYDAASGQVFVENWDSANVSVINDTNDRVVATVPARAGLDEGAGVVYDAATDEVFVAGNEVSVFNGTSDTVVATVPVGGCPDAAAYDSGKGEVFVANFCSNNVSVIASVPTYAVNFTTTPPTCGSITFNGTTYTNGQSVDVLSGTYPVSSTSCPGYTLQSLIGSGSVSVAAGEATVTGAGVLTATFTQVTYPVWFNESGLPPGTDWWVNVTGQAPMSATAASMSVALPNGSYTYTVATADKEFASIGGGFTVNGSALLEAVPFALVVYQVWFNETGLPTGTEWWVNGTVVGSYDSTTTSIAFEEPNGTYTVSVASADKDYSAPGGSFEVNGSAVSVAATFSLVTFPVTFTQTGLPSATEWYVNITGETPLDSTGATITTSLSNASYRFVVSTGDHLYAPSYTASFTVSGAAVPVSVAFGLVTYAVTFTEAGLPSTTEWWVNITDEAPLEGTISTITAELPNASYTFSVSTADKLYEPSYTTGFTVDGTTVPVSVAFSLVTYPLTFTESGLPGGTAWWVNGTILGSHESTTTTIAVDEPNGTYDYTVATVDKEFAAVGGSAAVNGAEVPKSVDFRLVTYTMTFTETGLPSGTNWSVAVEGVTHYSTGTTIVFIEPNASYAFTVGGVPGYSVNRSSGSETIHGAQVTELLTFTSTAKASTFLGLPTVEGYVLTGAIVAVAIVAIAAVFGRRRRKAPTPSADTPPPKAS